MIIHLVDVGSTSIKYSRCEKGGRQTAGSLPFPGPMARESPFFEVDAEEIMTPIKEILAPVQPGDRVVLSVQMHGYLLADGKGSLLTPYISWRDRRSECLPPEQRYPFDLPRWCGVSVKPNLPLSGLNAMRMMQPALFSEVRRFYTLGSLIAERLAGVNASHITDLAPTGMYDARSGAQRHIDFVRNILFPQSMAFGPLGMYRGAKVWTPVGDQQASVAGSGLVRDEYLLNLGTAAQACTLSEEEVYGDYESRPYFDGRTLCTITGLTGGRDYQALAADPEYASRRLAAEYGKAVSRLPARHAIRAVGGVCRHYRVLVEETLKRIGLPWTISEDADALDGLLRESERRCSG